MLGVTKPQYQFGFGPVDQLLYYKFLHCTFRSKLLPISWKLHKRIYYYYYYYYNFQQQLQCTKPIYFIQRMAKERKSHEKATTQQLHRSHGRKRRHFQSKHEEGRNLSKLTNKPPINMVLCFVLSCLVLCSSFVFVFLYKHTHFTS